MLEELLDWIRTLPPSAVYGLLFAGALVEYVVPPAPGDTVVVAGAALVVAFDWPVLPVFAVTLAGAVLGSALDLAVGRWLVHSGRLERLSPGRRQVVDRLIGVFERRGAVYLALNRFVPGIRALFFVAAGAAGVPWTHALFWSAVSAALWNACLIALGVLAGKNIELLEVWVGRGNAVLGVVLVGVLGWVGLTVWRATRSVDR